ncbi:MAG: hypothetical protein FWC79_05640 [Oscillospiraceae bacterium]|nr:hypothetical protein [Oscillospiraceae bacterium]
MNWFNDSFWTNKRNLMILGAVVLVIVAIILVVVFTGEEEEEIIRIDEQGITMRLQSITTRPPTVVETLEMIDISDADFLRETLANVVLLEEPRPVSGIQVIIDFNDGYELRFSLRDTELIVVENPEGIIVVGYMPEGLIEFATERFTEHL